MVVRLCIRRGRSEVGNWKRMPYEGSVLSEFPREVSLMPNLDREIADWYDGKLNKDKV